MPSGVPVATVAINGAKNAGILAAQILGTGDSDIQKIIVSYKNKLSEESIRKNEKLKS
jgi:5-(carboxyamino)imidazole ribonucleotide mutase